MKNKAIKKLYRAFALAENGELDNCLIERG